MTIARVTAQWRGFRGAPGYSNFFFHGAVADEQPNEAMATAVATFFRAFNQLFPEDLTIGIAPTIDSIDETTGQLVGQADVTPPPTVAGGGSANYSAASGAVVNWLTSGFVGGRRVRGRTFLVPLSSAVYDAAGDLTNAARTAISDAANALVADSATTGMVIWSRPRGGGGGSIHDVDGATVPDLGAILRSRRD